jgi:HK97 family phage major capsid protein
MNSLTQAAGGIFVPDEIAKELNMLIRDASCVERFARHIPMKRNTMNRRKQADGVNGYWVDAMEVKTKDAPTFEPYTLTAEKMAVIIPLEDQLLEDADTNIAGVVREDVVGAFAEDLDRTYLGYEPTSPFAQSLSGTTPAANTIAFGTGVDLAADFSLAMQALEVNGYQATGFIAHPAVKHVMRNMRDANNQPIFHENLSGAVPSYSFWGIPGCFTRQVQRAGSPLVSEILLAYFPYVMIGDRTGLQISRSMEATLTQGTETPINLWEQDMTAFRFVTRKGFVIKDEDALAKITGVT